MKNLSILFFTIFVFFLSANIKAQAIIKHTELISLSYDPNNINKKRKCDTITNTPKQTENKKLSAAELRFKRIFKKEKSQIEKILKDIEIVHKIFIKFFPKAKTYQEIEIEDVPEKRIHRSKTISIRVLVALHYADNGEISCVVLDSYQKNLYQENKWLQKFIRFRPTSIDQIKLQATKYSYNRMSDIDQYALENQLQILRSIFSSLLRTLYKMDLIIASRKYYETKNNKWQANF